MQSNQAITIKVPRFITFKDRREVEREIELEQRKRVTYRHVTKALSLQKWANDILRQGRSKLKKTAQLTYHKMSSSNSVHVTNIRGKRSFR